MKTVDEVLAYLKSLAFYTIKEKYKPVFKSPLSTDKRKTISLEYRNDLLTLTKVLGEEWVQNKIRENLPFFSFIVERDLTFKVEVDSVKKDISISFTF